MIALLFTSTFPVPFGLIVMFVFEAPEIVFVLNVIVPVVAADPVNPTEPSKPFEPV